VDRRVDIRCFLFVAASEVLASHFFPKNPATLNGNSFFFFFFLMLFIYVIIVTQAS